MHRSIAGSSRKEPLFSACKLLLGGGKEFCLDSENLLFCLDIVILLLLFLMLFARIKRGRVVVFFDSLFLATNSINTVHHMLYWLRRGGIRGQYPFFLDLLSVLNTDTNSSRERMANTDKSMPSSVTIQDRMAGKSHGVRLLREVR